MLGHLAVARVDDDELGAALLHVLERPLPVEQLGCGGIATPEHHEVGALPVRLVGAEAAVGAGLQPHVGAVADGAVAAGVGTAEQVRELVVQVRLGAVRTLEEAERLGAVLVPQRSQALRHLVERLIPGDLLPFALAALARALERLLQAVGVVLEVFPTILLQAGAHVALVVRVVGIALDLHDAPVLLRAEHAAVQVAQETRRPLDFPRRLDHNTAPLSPVAASAAIPGCHRLTQGATLRKDGG